MSLFPTFLAGAQGVITKATGAGVVYKWWSRGRELHGSDVVCGALISGFKDGESFKLHVYRTNKEDAPLGKLDATLDKGLAHATYTIDFEHTGEGGREYELFFVVEYDGQLISSPELSPKLLVDLTVPVFSE